MGRMSCYAEECVEKTNHTKSGHYFRHKKIARACKGAMDCYVGWVVSCECSRLFLDITALERCGVFKGSVSALELICIVMK